MSVPSLSSGAPDVLQKSRKMSMLRTAGAPLHHERIKNISFSLFPNNFTNQDLRFWDFEFYRFFRCPLIFTTTKTKQVKVVTAIQCAGNRREDMTAVKAVKGLGWSCGAVSNCEWTGVRLRDVLKHAGVNVDDPERDGIEHVQFEGERSLMSQRKCGDYRKVGVAHPSKLSSSPLFFSLLLVLPRATRSFAYTPLLTSGICLRFESNANQMRLLRQVATRLERGVVGAR